MKTIAVITLVLGLAATGAAAFRWYADHPHAFSMQQAPAARDGVPIKVDDPTISARYGPFQRSRSITSETDGLEQALAIRFTDAPMPPHSWHMPVLGNPRGVVIAIHGGSWFGVGEERLATMDDEVARWNARGYAVLNTSYRAGRESVVDVVRVYDAVRSWQGNGIPIGAIGASAGGHIAMILAAQRPDLAFVVSEAGPTEPSALTETPQSRMVQDAAFRAFGDDVTGAMSPVAQAHRITSPLLLLTASEDQVVPVAQMEAMVAARPSTIAIELEPGDQLWIHGAISLNAMDQLIRAENRLADDAALS